MHQNAQNSPLIKCDINLFMQKILSEPFEVQCYEVDVICCEENKLMSHGKSYVIMNSISIENVYLFPELTVGVVK